MSHFKTVEIADSKFKPDLLTFMTVKSKNLKGRGDIVFYIPETNETDLPLLTLMHGVYGSSWSWAFSGGAHLTAEEMISSKEVKPFIIAMPSDGLAGDGTGYFAHDNTDYEKWIIEDIPKAAQELTNKVSESSKLYIAGLSMGGFGALRLGAKYADKFSGISAHSAPESAQRLQQFIEEEVSGMIDLKAPDFSPLYWLKKNSAKLPPLRLDCGVDDELIEDNRHIHSELSKKGISHTYEEFSGAHTWDYWHEHLRDTLRFFFS